MTTPATGPLWGWTYALFLTHQLEEVVASLGDWVDETGGTGWPLADRYLRDSPLGSSRLGPRVATLVAQTAGMGTVAALTRRSLPATRAATTAIAGVMGAFFVGHLVVARRTRTAPPGTATAIFPGLVGVGALLWRIWR